MTALLLGCIGIAAAAPAAEELRAWSDTAVELRPDAWGHSSMRAVERLGLHAPLTDGWQMSADGGIRLRQQPYDDLQIDLYRLAVQGERVTLGRHVRLDPRGLQRLDGLSTLVDDGGAFAGEAWAGRLWHPAFWDTGNTVVAGGQVTARPLSDGRPSRLTHLTVGAEGRLADGGGEPSTEAREPDALWFGVRTHLAAATSTPRGHQADGLVEVEPGTGARGHLRGTLPAGRRLDLGADLRWEGLRPATSPYGVATPIDWLAARGYGVGTLRASWTRGRLAVAGHGGPTVRPDGRVGGLGRLGVHYSDRGITTGLFLTAAGLDGAWLAGGGGAAGLATGPVYLHTDLGVYRHRGLDGGAAAVWEGRVEGRVPLHEAGIDLRRRVSLGVQGAAGTDRQLARWIRGGVALHAAMGRSR